MSEPSAPETPRNRLAVAIMSFDRPQYLERILQSVRAQLPFRDTEASFYLFQDGHRSPRTGATFGDPAGMAASVELFRRYFPEGQVFEAGINLGVAMNFDRAERVVFEEAGFEAAVFLEDDMILQPYYFRVLETLLGQAQARDDIGMVSALGYRNASPLPEQRRRERDICLMDEHNWAFALTRRAWQARDEVLQPYLGQVADIDYRERDKGDRKLAIKMLQQSFGRHGQGYLSSQDSMKNMAMELLGLHRVTTFTNNARYIGREGEHSTAEKFESGGYHRTVLYDREPAAFEIPSSEDLSRMRLELQYR